MDGNLYIVIVDNMNAYLVKDTGIDKAMLRIIKNTCVTKSVDVFHANVAINKTDFHILSINDAEVANLVTCLL